MNKRIYIYPKRENIINLIKIHGPSLKVYVVLGKDEGFWVKLKRIHLIRNIKLIYIPSEIEQLTSIMERLRSEKGCSWDREQTHDSLLPYLLEEANEYCEAVGTKDMDKVMDELGDLLLQIVFHSQIAYEKGEFDFESCAKHIKEKLVFRHPHVFSKEFNKGKVYTPKEVQEIWQKQKKKERMT